MNTSLWSGRDDEADPSRSGRKQLPARNLAEEHVPPQARHAQGQIDPDMFATAVTIHNGVINQANGQRWPNDDRSLEKSFVSSCEDMVIECQNWTRKQCRPDDDNSLQRTTEALEAAASALDVMQSLETALNENVKDPRGGRSPAREVIANHESDQVLAADREREGDNRHLDKPVAHAWIVVAASVFAVLDLLLLWRPVLQLAALDSARMLFQWVLAGAFSAAIALFIELSVRHYQRTERQSTNRRDAVRDHNRTVHRAVASDNRSALAEQPPDLKQVDTEDGKLRFAGGLLLGVATATAVIGAARVAVLARGSGLSILETALFASIMALFLGGLVVLLGFLSCRGNQLGDRLSIGTEAVESVEQRGRESREEVAEAREEARQLLVAADEAAAQGAETRAWVIEGYQRSMRLACRWCGLDASVFADVRFDACSRPLAEEAASKKADTLDMLADIDKWLAKPQGVVERPRQQETVPARHAAPEPASGKVRLVAPPDDGQCSTVIPLALQLPEEPRISRQLMALGAAIAVATAVIAAILASPPEDDSDLQVIGSTPAGSAAVARFPASMARTEDAVGTS